MTMTNEQLDEAVKRIAWLDSKICEAIAAIDAGYSERKDIEWERAEANLCNEARAMAKILDQLWDEREKHLRIIRNQEAVMVEQEATIEQQRTELRNALYPGGIKHPQQAEWYWLIESAKELAEKDGAWICAGHGANFTQDCDECWWVKRCNEKDAEIERLNRVIGSFRYALLKYREEEWLSGEDGIAAEALESETITFTKKED